MNTAYMYVQIFFTHCTITCKRTRVNAVFMIYIKHKGSRVRTFLNAAKKDEDKTSSKVFWTKFD